MVEASIPIIGRTCASPRTGKYIGFTGLKEEEWEFCLGVNSSFKLISLIHSNGLQPRRSRSKRRDGLIAIS